MTSGFCCVNAKCAEHGKREVGNLLVCGWSGQTNRPLRCRRCLSRHGVAGGQYTQSFWLGEREEGPPLISGFGTATQTILTKALRDLNG